MTDDHKPTPHIDAAHAKPKATRPPAPKAATKAAPKPAPRPPIPSVNIPMEAPSKGKLAGAVAATVGAIGLIGYGIAGVAGRMLRRGR